jgi:phosphopantetheine--protein transferase-like protein
LAFLHLWSIDLGREPAPQRRAAANDALRQILAIHLPEEAADIALVKGEHGKPRLAAGGLEFSLSHSGEMALVAVSDEHPVGVDVEEVRRDRDPLALAERALSPDDVLAVREAEPARRDLIFHQRWTRNEARLKCLGVGIFRHSLLATETLAVEDLEVRAGYVAAVAVRAAEFPPLSYRTFDPGPLQKDGNRVS